MHQTIQYTMTLEDLQAIMSARQSTRRLKGWKRILVRTLVVLFVMLLISKAYEAMIVAPLLKGTLLFGAYAGFSLVLVLAFDQFTTHILYRLTFARQKSRIKETTLTFEDERLNWSAKGGAGHLDWSTFEPPVLQADLMVLFFSGIHAFIVPRRAFASQQEFEQTCNYIRQKIAADSPASALDAKR